MADTAICVDEALKPMRSALCFVVRVRLRLAGGGVSSPSTSMTGRNPTGESVLLPFPGVMPGSGDVTLTSTPVGVACDSGVAVASAAATRPNGPRNRAGVVGGGVVESRITESAGGGASGASPDPPGSSSLLSSTPPSSPSSLLSAKPPAESSVSCPDRGERWSRDRSCRPGSITNRMVSLRSSPIHSPCSASRRSNTARCT
mmetsp:Transcript_998/g.3172  ORF Transcript_998/g.3172 Transcript_998/m.3172 type:complete len:202 (+) Transcript_998:1802-2407(+)